MTVWYGVCAPAKTPKPILTRLEGGMAKALAAPDLRKRFADQGVEVRNIAGAEFDAYYKAELARWAKVVQDTGIKPE